MRFARLPIADDAAGLIPERRQHERCSDVKQPEVTVMTTSNCLAQVDNLSNHGCKVVGELADIRCGQFVVLRLHGVGRVNGLVRWANGTAAGVEFTRALGDSIIGMVESKGSAASISLL
jgi:hypothetical protein